LRSGGAGRGNGPQLIRNPQETAPSGTACKKLVFVSAYSGPFYGNGKQEGGDGAGGYGYEQGDRVGMWHASAGPWQLAAAPWAVGRRQRQRAPAPGPTSTALPPWAHPPPPPPPPLSAIGAAGVGLNFAI
jgi:hypothetical protein